MELALSSSAAWWFLPFVLPICFYVAFTDMREMRITNQAVIVLAVVFLIVGLIALSLPVYGMRVLQMVGVLVVGILLNAGGAIGAGDAKFAATAAPFVAAGDLFVVLMIFTATLLAAFLTHRLAKFSPLRRVAPDWASWDRGWDFPMGLALGGTLAIYLVLGAVYGM